jgi:glyoxylase-like metal-dependent hydrolase (beta-lactamase superfamily II)
VGLERRLISMEFLNRLNNVHLIDAKMWGFERYNAAYVVEGSEIALIDTGEPGQLETVRAAIKAHGFNLSDISYIFITHCEHLDHAGNIAPLLRESPRAKVYLNPLGHGYLVNPESLNLKARMSPQLISRRIHTPMEAVPESRICDLQDGQVFDLGEGEKLKIIFAPGHQPSGLVILEEKNQGLFINDLVGICFQDCDVHYPLNPLGSDNLRAIESLKTLMKLPLRALYMGHFGISQSPGPIIAQSIAKIQKLVDIGTQCMRQGKPELIANKVYEVIKPELEKLKPTRRPVYDYATQEHVPFQLQLFTKYCQDRLR